MKQKGNRAPRPVNNCCGALPLAGYDAFYQIRAPPSPVRTLPTAQISLNRRAIPRNSPVSIRTTGEKFCSCSISRKQSSSGLSVVNCPTRGRAVMIPRSSSRRGPLCSLGDLLADHAALPSHPVSLFRSAVSSPPNRSPPVFLAQIIALLCTLPSLPGDGKNFLPVPR